ncbi:MAG: DUF418 domain-containing protein [Chitinophagaceae bacterium]
MSSLLQPVHRNERVYLLDILRGFAILGIFIMNLWAFTFYFGYTDAEKAAVALAKYDGITTFFQHMFLEGKFYSLFSMLFGIGFAIYLSKAGENKKVLSLFKRRLLILLCIGFIHLILWVGDIVAFYALLGFLLIAFRNFSNKNLLILAAVCIFLPIPLYALKMWNPAIFNPGQFLITYNLQLDAQLGINSERDLIGVLGGNNFWQMLQVNFHGILWRFGDLLFQDRIFKVFGMFLIGLVIGRTKFYSHLEQNKKLLKQILFVGLAVGLPANIIFSIFMIKGGYYQLTINGLYQTIAYSFGVAPLALAYASFFALLYLKPSIRKFLNTLAPVGRMALTNYIMHSIIGLLFFTQLGFGISNMGPTAWTLFALCVYIFQIFTSTIWLRFFNYGPLEWLWRSATYGKWQAMIKKKNLIDVELTLQPHSTQTIIK